MLRHLVVILTLAAIPIYLCVIPRTPKPSVTRDQPVEDSGWRRTLKNDGVSENLFASRLHIRRETRTDYREDNGRRIPFSVSVAVVTNLSNRPLYYLAQNGSGDASVITDGFDYAEELQNGSWVNIYGGAGCGMGLDEHELGPGRYVAFRTFNEANAKATGRRIRQWIIFSEDVKPLPFQRTRIESLTLLADSDHSRE